MPYPHLMGTPLQLAGQYVGETCGLQYKLYFFSSICSVEEFLRSHLWNILCPLEGLLSCLFRQPFWFSSISHFLFSICFSTSSSVSKDGLRSPRCQAAIQFFFLIHFLFKVVWTAYVRYLMVTTGTCLPIFTLLWGSLDVLWISHQLYWWSFWIYPKAHLLVGFLAIPPGMSWDHPRYIYSHVCSPGLSFPLFELLTPL